ncbi:MAG: hypothetical protein RLY93_08215 [Sumerlaeia bacterium]
MRFFLRATLLMGVLAVTVLASEGMASEAPATESSAPQVDPQETNVVREERIGKHRERVRAEIERRKAERELDGHSADTEQRQEPTPDIPDASFRSFDHGPIPPWPGPGEEPRVKAIFSDARVPIVLQVMKNQAETPIELHPSLADARVSVYEPDSPLTKALDAIRRSIEESEQTRVEVARRPDGAYFLYPPDKIETGSGEDAFRFLLGAGAFQRLADQEAVAVQVGENDNRVLREGESVSLELPGTEGIEVRVLSVGTEHPDARVAIGDSDFWIAGMPRDAQDREVKLVFNHAPAEQVLKVTFKQLGLPVRVLPGIAGQRLSIFKPGSKGSQVVETIAATLGAQMRYAPDGTLVWGTSEELNGEAWDKIAAEMTP